MKKQNKTENTFQKTQQIDYCLLQEGDCRESEMSEGSHLCVVRSFRFMTMITLQCIGCLMLYS